MSVAGWTQPEGTPGARCTHTPCSASGPQALNSFTLCFSLTTFGEIFNPCMSRAVMWSTHESSLPGSAGRCPVWPPHLVPSKSLFQSQPLTALASVALHRQGSAGGPALSCRTHGASAFCSLQVAALTPQEELPTVGPPPLPHSCGTPLSLHPCSASP